MTSCSPAADTMRSFTRSLSDTDFTNCHELEVEAPRQQAELQSGATFSPVQGPKMAGRSSGIERRCICSLKRAGVYALGNRCRRGDLFQSVKVRVIRVS